MIPFPDKKYSIIYADPPWSYSDSGCSGAAAAQYATMSINELKQLPVNPAGGGIAADDCVLFMWATYPKMQEALDLIEAWGFKYKSIAFQWIKQNRSGNGYFFGLGRWTRGNTEPCLIAIKGKPKRISAGVGQLVFSPLRRHSQKPAEVRDKIVELMGDLPRIELFAREAAPGWDAWGNEAPTPEVKDVPADSVELAHVATPEDTEHGESWSAASEAIFKKYNELLEAMIPDEPEPILSPHQPGDGGILTMPLHDNVPEPPTDDWQLTTCPVCGAECWQTDTARRILALEPDVRTACTACALKGLGK